VKGSRQRVMHCPCGKEKVLALGLCVGAPLCCDSTYARAGMLVKSSVPVSLPSCPKPKFGSVRM
jgi:hypothetical protein